MLDSALTLFSTEFLRVEISSLLAVFVFDILLFDIEQLIIRQEIDVI